MKVLQFLLLACLLVAALHIEDSLGGTGALKPIDKDFCRAMDRILDNIVYSTDYCIFMIMEHIDCTYYYENTTVVVVSMEKMFDGFVAEVQKKFYCDKTFTVLDNWNTFKYFMRGRNLTKKFEPYTRIGFYARFNSSDHGKIFDDDHLDQIYFGGLQVYYGRVLTEELFELENALSGELVRYTNISHLERTYKSIRNLLLHPMFDCSLRPCEVKVSLYHCDPFVRRERTSRRVR